MVTSRYELGRALAFTHRASPYRLPETLVSATDARHNTNLVGWFGILFLSSGALLVVTTVILSWSKDQAAGGSVNHDFQIVVADPVTPGFDEAAISFVSRLRASQSFDTQNVSFVALRENPVCDVRLSACAPEPSAAPSREWDGELRWQESRDGAGWTTQSCEALAILTVSNAWQIVGSRWCYVLPR